MLTYVIRRVEFSPVSAGQDLSSDGAGLGGDGHGVSA